MGSIEAIGGGLKERFAEALKPGCVSDDAQILEGYAGDCSFTAKGDPKLAVYPETREEVQAIVRLASATRTPLTPVSSGPPRFRGDTVPERGGVIVDFSRMNRILKIDPLKRYVRVEPGVTYGELIPALREQGLRINAPLLPRSSKSVVASRLEREPVLIPKYQYDYVDPLLTLEVVYGEGDDFRTGSASGPGVPGTLKADMVAPWGPGVVDFFRLVSAAQGSMGLVTWATLKAEVLPSVRTLFFIAIDDVAKLTVPMNELLRQRVVDECLALDDLTLAAILCDGKADETASLRARLPRWTVLAAVAGYERHGEERARIHEKKLKEICANAGIEPRTSQPGFVGREGDILDLLSNAGGAAPHWKLRGKSACHDIFFLTPMSKVSRHIALMQEIAARSPYPKNDIGCYVQPMVQGRGCHVEFTLPCNAEDKAETAVVRSLFLDASKALMDDGAFFSRPYGPWADMVFSRDPGGVAALKKLKAIFDPNNILNPGKLCF